MERLVKTPFMIDFEAQCVATRLAWDIYNANAEMLGTGAIKAEREARLRRTIGERTQLMIDIAKAVNS